MKHYLHLLLLFLFIQTVSYAQFPNWSWAKSAGNGVNDYGNSIAISNADIIYSVGQFNSANINFGTVALTNSSSKETNDIFIVSYTKDGELLWAKSFGGTGDDFAKSIAIDRQGNLYIAGGFTSRSIVFGKDTLTNIGSQGTNDAYIAKLTSTGDVVWAKSMGGKDDDKANSIAVDVDANIYITGNFYSWKIKFQNGDSISNKGNGNSTDVFSVKYNANGNVVWAKSINGNRYDYAYGIAIDKGNNVYITGGSYSTTIDIDSVTVLKNTAIAPNKDNIQRAPIQWEWIDTLGQIIDTLKTKGYNNKKNKHIQLVMSGNEEPSFEKIFIVKLSSSGKLQWAQNVAGSDDEEGTSITTDNNDNVFITGKFKSTSITMDTTTMNNNGSNDIFIAKYSSDGKNYWAKSVGGTADDRGNSIITDVYGNAYITGWFGSRKAVFGKSSITNSGTKDFTDMFIAKYDSDGNALWSENAKGADNDWSNGVAIDKQGNIYLTGGFDSSELTFGETKLTNPKGKSFFIAKINAK